MPEDMIAKHFIAGLRDDIRMPKNSEHLERCYGGKPTEYGTVGQKDIADGSDGATFGWPFPQMFKGEGFTLRLMPTQLGYIKANGDFQALTVYDAAPSGSQLLAATTFASGWTLPANGWAASGSNAVHTPGTAGAAVSVGTIAAAGLYRFTVNVSSVTTDLSVSDKLYIKIGTDSSYSFIPRVGVNEFEVVTTGTTQAVSIFAELNVGITISSITCKLIAAVSDLGLTTTSKPFHMVSFGKIWFLVGETMVLMCAPICGVAGRYTTDANYEFNWRIVKWTTTKMRSMANFNNRLYVAGFDATDSRYAEAEFIEAFDVFVKKHVGVMYEFFNVAKNVLFYGHWAGGDVNWPFAADLALLGCMDSVQTAAYSDFYIQSLKDGDQGFVLMPLQGRILRTEPLANALICYCEDGVVLVMPGQENQNVHSVRIISNQGLGDKGLVTVGTGGQFHMYVDVNGKLQLISSDYSVRELGYQEFLLPLITNKATAPPVACFDPDESEAYLGNGTISFNRTKAGLGEIWTAVTSLFHSPTDGLSGGRSSIAPVSGKARIVTGAIDYGNRNFKSVHDLDVGSEDVTNLKIRVYYKTNYTSDWVVTDWFSATRGGFAIPLVSGYEFKYELEYTPGANARIEYIKANWQIRDHRNFRRQAGRI